MLLVLYWYQSRGAEKFLYIPIIVGNMTEMNTGNYFDIRPDKEKKRKKEQFKATKLFDF